MNHAPESLVIGQPACKQSGFALVVSLSLMTMMVLLALSLASLTTMELHNSSVQREVDTARENALLGMKIAVSRLQESVGPDQRFTATSAITGEGVNPNITGVWKEDATSAFTWLVSGNTLNAPLEVTPATLPDPATAASSQEVFLVDLGVVSRVEDRIKVEKESIVVDGVAGHYAYWVGDEGVKVSMAINDEIDQLTYDNTRPDDTPPNNIPGAGHDWRKGEYRDELRQMTQSFPSFWLPLGLSFEYVAGSMSLSSLATLSTASLLPGMVNEDAWREQFHSITPLSRAVLVNHTASNGALRHDLSDSPQTEGSVKLFTRKRPVELASGNMGHVMLPFEKASHSDVFPHFSIGPVLTEFVVRYNFYRNYQGKLTIKQELQLELWNPYATPIETPTRLIVNLEDMPVFEVTVDGETYNVEVDNYFKDPYGRGPYIPIDVEWAPGEIKWFKGSGGTRRLSADGPPRSEKVLDSNGDEIDVPDPETGAPVTITVRAPELTGEGESRFTVKLETHDVVAEYRPQLSYKSVVATNASPTLNSDGWMFGYAFEMDDDLARWVDGSQTNSADPRRVDMDKVDFADEDYEYWSDNPTDILSPINLTGSDTFNSQQSYILYDLPTQEPTTVGTLTNLIGQRPNMLGNSWGDSANIYFDRYYFSTLPRWHEWDIQSLPVLPNRYMEFYLSGDDPVEIGDPFGSSGINSDYMFDVLHAAKYLMIRGAFNINSTSRDAWRAMLSGVCIEDWSQENSSIERDLNHAYFRHSMNATRLPIAPDEEITESNAFSRSGVTLTSAQIESLADAVVSRIVARGYPFNSISEFLNAGVIEQAIVESGVNDSAEALGIVKNAPAYLSQADVVKPIAPMLTPRSDTYLVRSYGDVTNPYTGEVTASVWCEAVVQRVPNLTSPVSGVTDPARDPLVPDPEKYPFGREMKIISFRYLSPDEV